MFLMQLSKNIHDGHCPGVLGPEDLQHPKHSYNDYEESRNIPDSGIRYV